MQVSHFRRTATTNGAKLDFDAGSSNIFGYAAEDHIFADNRLSGMMIPVNLVAREQPG
jgi:hypothetical protein